MRNHLEEECLNWRKQLVYHDKGYNEAERHYSKNQDQYPRSADRMVCVQDARLHQAIENEVLMMQNVDCKHRTSQPVHCPGLEMKPPRNDK